MRKFKARIWDQKEKCFHRPEQEGHTAAISLDGTICFGYVGGNMVSVEVDEEGNTDYEIQMFSGLMDSDGKPIYEGDILEWSVPSNQPAMESRGVVAFSEAACYMAGQTPLSSVSFKSEIIGNIFENASILEKKLNKNI
jgi:hypothetical protein